MLKNYRVVWECSITGQIGHNIIEAVSAREAVKETYTKHDGCISIMSVYVEVSMVEWA